MVLPYFKRVSKRFSLASHWYLNYCIPQVTYLISRKTLERFYHGAQKITPLVRVEIHAKFLHRNKTAQFQSSNNSTPEELLFLGSLSSCQSVLHCLEGLSTLNKKQLPLIFVDLKLTYKE